MRAAQTGRLELLGLVVVGNLAICILATVANSPNFDVNPGFGLFKWMSVVLTLLCGLGSLAMMRRQ